MGQMVSRWVVAEEVPVDDADVDGDGVARAAFRDELVDRAVLAYLALCEAFTEQSRRQFADPQVMLAGRPGTLRMGDAPSVALVASAVEVLTTSFVIAVRLRPIGGASPDDDEPVDARCVVRLLDPGSGMPLAIDRTVRDELIALEQAARHIG